MTEKTKKTASKVQSAKKAQPVKKAKGQKYVRLADR